MITLILLFILQIRVIEAIDANTQDIVESETRILQDYATEQVDSSNDARTAPSQQDIDSSKTVIAASTATNENRIDLVKASNTKNRRNRKTNTKKAKSKKIKKKDEINLIINKCNLLIKLIEQTGQSESAKIFEKLRDLFLNNKTELDILYMGNEQQRIDKITQYLNKISKLAADLAQQCTKENSLKKNESEAEPTVQNKTIEEIKEQYKNIKLRESKNAKKSSRSLDE